MKEGWIEKFKRLHYQLRISKILQIVIAQRLTVQTDNDPMNTSKATQDFFLK